MTQKTIFEIQEKIGYTFKDANLLVQAFIRKSFSEENSNWNNNEQLEFVGDKALDFIVVKKLTELHANKREIIAQSLDSIINGEKPSSENVVDATVFEFTRTEGEMTEIKKQIVQTSFLSSAIERLGLENYLLMSKGDIKNGVQNEPHVKEDLLESIIGAVAIDSGWNIEVIERVVDTMLMLDESTLDGTNDEIDYVSYVHNWHQKEYGTEPSYRFYDHDDSDRFYDCYIDLSGFSKQFEGSARSKKEAIRLTAKRVYEHLQSVSKTSNTIVDIIGEFNLDTAINKLQILQDKKIISGLEYYFREEVSGEKNNGNPTWFCRCKIDNLNVSGEWGDSKKTTAKKAAAYEILRALVTGQDSFFDDLCAKQLIKIKENNHE